MGNLDASEREKRLAARLEARKERLRLHLQAHTPCSAVPHGLNKACTYPFAPHSLEGRRLLTC